MKTIYSIICASAALIAVACTKSPQLSEPQQIRFQTNIRQTKASGTAFESGDKMGVWAVEYKNEESQPLQIGGNFLNNEMIAYNGSTWNPSRTLYWSESALDFYAIYPYNADISSVDSYSSTLPLNQNSEEIPSELSGYEAADIMFAKAENVKKADSPVMLNFYHLMSKCTVKIIKGAEFEGNIPDDIVVHIYNTVVDYKLDIVRGTLGKDPLGQRKTITMKKLGSQLFEAIVVPQNIELSTPLIEVTMGGIAYLLNYSLSFKPGYNHTINLTLNTSPDQEKIEISIDPQVDTWN